MRIVKAAAASILVTMIVVVALAALAIASGMALFGMRGLGATAVYFVVWWTLLFAVLPFGVRSQAESGTIVSGSEPGAPDIPMLREKAIWTTLAASGVFVVGAALLPLIGP